MNFNVSQLIGIIGIAMSAVEKIRGAKGGDKEAAVIEVVQDAIPQLEGLTGVDFVNDPALADLLAQYIAARKALAKAIAAAQALKPHVSA